MVRLLRVPPPTPPRRDRFLIFLLIGFIHIVISMQCLLFYMFSSSKESDGLLSTTSSFLRSPQQKKDDNFVIHPILRHLHLDSDTMFESLLMNHPHPTENDYVLEVGCFSLAQSSFSSLMGFSTLSFDPSPKNFNRMERQYQDLSDVQKARMTLYNKAVSNVSGDKLLFSTNGGTGDHVVGVNLDEREQAGRNNNIDTTEVETIALDDVLDTDVFGKNKDANLYLVKIDVQGQEANVLKGLSRHLQKARFVLLEYWVDALDQAKGVEMGTCSSVKDILEVLHKANFDLFDLAFQSHPKGDYEGGPSRAYVSDFFRPTDPYEQCQWFAKAGQEGRNHGYQMGYWTDILAIRRDDYSANEIGNLNLQGRRPIAPGIAKNKNPAWQERMQLRNIIGSKQLNSASDAKKAEDAAKM